jgi:long-chain acyl-CoA synthetase
MRKTGGITYALFRFFVAVGNLHSQMDRKMFRKTARFGNDYIVLVWLGFFIPWLLLYPIKLLGSKLVFSKIRAKLGNAFKVGVSGEVHYHLQSITSSGLLE